MKRRVMFVALIVLFIHVTIILTGCLVIPLYERFNIDGDTVVSIEIYDLSLCENIFMGSAFLETESSVYALPNEQNVNLITLHLSEFPHALHRGDSSCSERRGALPSAEQARQQAVLRAYRRY